LTSLLAGGAGNPPAHPGVNRLCNVLKTKRVHFDQIPKDLHWGWRHAYLQDPDGKGLSLYCAGDKRLHKSDYPG
jgi:hypothetical protein